MASLQRSAAPVDPAAVATRALFQAAELLRLPQQELAAIVHVSPATVSRWASGGSQLKLDSAEGQTALLFLRVFRSLDTLVGGDAAKARAWLTAPNRHLGSVPLERMRSLEGLVNVSDYLDAMRGKA